VSEDGASSIVVIALLGNVFSPRWARARVRDSGAPSLDFSAMNVALRSGAGSCWVLTERGRDAVRQGADELAIGPSSMTWESGDLVVRIDERSAPWGSRVRGTIRLAPLAESAMVVELDPCGLHTWSPRIPIARVEVEFEEPRVRFTGTGYLDANQGEEPLEDAFRSWSWSRVSDGERVSIAYDVTTRDGVERARAFRGGRGCELAAVSTDALVELPATRFGLVRAARGESTKIDVVRALEDGPFYARSVLRSTIDGRAALGMHETVSLDRFRCAWVKFLVPFRMRVEAA
jgi:carotenoid 1,2-hydratase